MLRGGYSVLSSSILGAGLPALQHVWQTCCFATKSPPYLKDAAKAPAASQKGRPSKTVPKEPWQKRPPSGYTLFIKDRAANVGGSTAAAMVKQLAQEWNSMSEQQKAPYLQEAAVLKSETLQAREQAKGPKKPPSAYNIYYQEQFPLVAKPGMKMPDAAREIAKLWKAVPDDEKARRKAAADQAKEAWKAANS